MIKKIYETVDFFLKKCSDFFLSFLSKYHTYIFLFVILVLSLVARISAFDNVSNDLKSFIIPWYKNFYNDGIVALGYEIGDYTPAYMYFLYFISLFKVNPEAIEFVHFVKIFSIIFDYISAVFVFLIVKRLTKNEIISLVGSALFLFSPTVFLNGAYWGQCDSIYVTFLIAAVYFLLTNHSRTAHIMLGLAFSFKLQTIFILPIFLLYYAQRKALFRHLIYVPIIYLLMALPAVICGRDFDRLLILYFNQGAQYTQLTLNSATFYSILYPNFQSKETLEGWAIITAVAMTGIFGYLIYALKVKIDEKLTITITTFFSILMPFFMPHMHERYFYLADALCLIYALINPKKCYVAILAILSSMICYCLYLFSFPLLINSSTTLKVGAAMYIICLISLAKDIFSAPRDVEKIEGK